MSGETTIVCDAPRTKPCHEDCRHHLCRAAAAAIRAEHQRIADNVAASLFGGMADHLQHEVREALDQHGDVRAEMPRTHARAVEALERLTELARRAR
jgi:hypothetical protein